MTTIKFKCTLLSDVILNQKAATDGPNKTLDFIPGSSFLGIAASRLYSELEKKASWDIFQDKQDFIKRITPAAKLHLQQVFLCTK